MLVYCVSHYIVQGVAKVTVHIYTLITQNDMKIKIYLRVITDEMKIWGFFNVLAF